MRKSDFPVKTFFVTGVVLLTLISTASVRAQESPFEWYDTFREAPPNPTLIAQMSRDRNIFRQLNIRAILAIIKFELKFGKWRRVSRQTRKELLAILEDKRLRIEFTGKQSKLAHSSGGQTLSTRRFIINGEGFLRLGAPKPPAEIAQILLHEIAHVHSLRHDWFPNVGNKERFPKLVEDDLPLRYFTANMIGQINRYIAEYAAENRNGNDPSGTGSIQCPQTRFNLVRNGSAGKFKTDFGGRKSASCDYSSSSWRTGLLSISLTLLKPGERCYRTADSRSDWVVGPSGNMTVAFSGTHANKISGREKQAAIAHMFRQGSPIARTCRR